MRFLLSALFLLLGPPILPARATPPTPHLANLTVSPSAIPKSGSATVTLTLSRPAPAGGALVTLASDNAALTLPPSITIPAGAGSTTFSVSSGSVTAASLVTISGSYGGWTQEDDLSVLPPGLSFNIPSVNVDPGNGCAVVMWARLPDETVLGYNVYRLSGGTATLLTPKPVWFNYYPDVGLTNDTVTYTYKVAAVDVLGQEHSRSSPVSVTPSSATATWNWVKTPATATDDFTLSLQLSNGAYAFAASMLIDGEYVGTGCAPRGVAVGGVPTNVTDSTLDSSGLSNGPHTVQFLGFLDQNRTVACVTPPITVQVSNVLSSFLLTQSIFQPDHGQVCFISATAPVGSTWTAQVTRDDTGGVIRTWQGSGPTVRLAWDGRDAAGSPAPDADYTFQVTVPSAGLAARPMMGAGATTKLKHMKLARVNPKF